MRGPEYQGAGKVMLYKAPTTSLLRNAHRGCSLGEAGEGEPWTDCIRASVGVGGRSKERWGELSRVGYCDRRRGLRTRW